MRKVSIAVLIAGMLAVIVLAGCGGGGGSSSSGGGGGDLSGGVTLTGRVLRTVGATQTTTPVPGVKVTIGNPPASGYSDANGRFTISLTGRNGTHLLQEVSPLVFSVDVSGTNVPAGYPMYLKARYLDYMGTDPSAYVWTSKTALPIPPQVYNPNALSTDLGTIYVDYYDDASGSDSPPRLLDPDEYEDGGSDGGGGSGGGGGGGGGGGDVPPPPSF